MSTVYIDVEVHVHCIDIARESVLFPEVAGLMEVLKYLDFRSLSFADWCNFFVSVAIL